LRSIGHFDLAYYDGAVSFLNTGTLSKRFDQDREVVVIFARDPQSEIYVARQDGGTHDSRQLGDHALKALGRCAGLEFYVDECFYKKAQLMSVNLGPKVADYS